MPCNINHLSGTKAETVLTKSISTKDDQLETTKIKLMFLIQYKYKLILSLYLHFRFQCRHFLKSFTDKTRNEFLALAISSTCPINHNILHYTILVTREKCHKSCQCLISYIPTLFFFYFYMAQLK